MDNWVSEAQRATGSARLTIFTGGHFGVVMSHGLRVRGHVCSLQCFFFSFFLTIGSVWTSLRYYLVVFLRTTLELVPTLEARGDVRRMKQTLPVFCGWHVSWA